jgi:hypothetical protein
MTKKYKACPSWLALSEDRSTFVFLPERAAIVRRIFELSLTGLGCYTIAKQLDHQNVPAFGPSGRWDQSTIHKMLASRATIGEHQPKRYVGAKEYPFGDPVRNYYPAVIEEDLFVAVQEARQKNLKQGRGRKGKYITNLFSKSLMCAHCGGPVKFHSNKSYKSLICVAVLKNRGCFRRAWSCGDFERSLFDFLLKLETEQTLEESERRTLSEITPHIRALEGPSLYDARVRIAAALPKTISELKLGPAGLPPTPDHSSGRILRDQPGRFFEVRLSGSDVSRVSVSPSGLT